MSDSVEYTKNPDVSWRTVEGQAVLIHNRLGEIQVLNEVGTFVWEHFDEGMETVAGKIAETYGIPVDTARNDLLDFFKELLESGALVEAPPENA